MIVGDRLLNEEMEIRFIMNFLNGWLADKMQDSHGEIIAADKVKYFYISYQGLCFCTQTKKY